MDDIIRLLISLIVLAVTLPAFFTSLIYLMPYRTLEIQNSIVQGPRRSFLIGGINALFFGLVIAVFANEGDGGGLIAMLVLLFVSALAFMGLASFVKILQERIFGNDDFTSTLKTAVLFTGALLTPIVGWFIVLPILSVMGLGASISRLVRRRKNKAEAPYP